MATQGARPGRIAPAVGVARRPLTVSPDLAELRTLCVAADLGTLGRAAVRLGVSQPSLSRRLRSLEDTVGVQLLERSRQGVVLTPAGRRLYEHARGLLEASDTVADVMIGLQAQAAGPVRLGCSHSAAIAFVGDLLATLNERPTLAVELITANSQLVRGMVADGRASVGVGASRPRRTPNPGVRTVELGEDAVVCAVPPGHPWAGGRRLPLKRFLSTRMVVRDAQSNSRWTVEAVLRERGLEPAVPLFQAPTPQAAIRAAGTLRAPVLVSRGALAGTGFVAVEVEELAFPRTFELVLPAYGEPTGEVAELVGLIREQARARLG
jgi:DNA-binding transcriptional LysR family regulator